MGGAESRVGEASRHYTKEGLAKELKAIAEGKERVHLALAKCDLESAKVLADALAKDDSLQHLGMYRSDLGDESIVVIANALMKTSSLRELQLCGNDIGLDGVKALVGVLAKHSSLRNLELDENRIGWSGAQALASAIAEHVSLQELKLLGNKVGDLGAVELARALVVSSSLQILDLTNNQIGSNGAKALGGALARNLSLKEINLMTNTIGSDGAKALGAALVTNSRLQKLNLGFNAIGDDGASMLALGLGKNSSLLLIDVCENDLGPNGAKALAGALVMNSSLEELSFDMNKIGSDGAKALGAALAKNTALLRLDLSNCGIDSDGAKALADGLAKNASLQKIFLCENSIGADGAEAFGTALIRNTSLKHLDLSSNPIGDDGVVALASALKENSSSLEELNLWETKMGDVGTGALAAALESNEILREIELNSKDSVGAARIRAHLKLVMGEVQSLNLAAQEALQANESVRWGRAKLIVVGKVSVGKTAMVRSLLNQAFNPEYDPTVGVDLALLYTRDWKMSEKIDNADLGVQLAKYAYRQPNLAQRLSRRMSKVAALLSVPRKSVRATTRASASRGQVPHFDEKEISQAIETPVRLHVKEQAHKPDEEVSFMIWDHSGQEMFHSLHRLFLTQHGVYALVFDMREVLGKTRRAGVLDERDLEHLDSQEDALKALRFWIGSIRLHAPNANIVIVGTHLDQVPDPEDHQTINKTLDAKILMRSDVKASVVRNEAERLHFFPIDNTDEEDAGERVARLRSALFESVAEKDFCKQKVPLRWSYCLKQLLSQENNFVSLDEVKKIAKEKCYISKEESHKMLRYMHEVGALVHLATGQNDELHRTVVTRPQWLLRSLSSVIRDPSMDKRKEDDDEVDGVDGAGGDNKGFPPELEGALDDWPGREAGNQGLWSQAMDQFMALITPTLTTDMSPRMSDDDEESALQSLSPFDDRSVRGVASRDLLERLWRDQPIAYLAKLAQTMLLACPSPWIGEDDDDDEEGALLLPSLLRPVDKDDRENALRDLGKGHVLAYIQFAVLPEDIFQRLIASLAQSLPALMSVASPALYSDFAAVVIDDVRMILETSDNRVLLYFSKQSVYKSLTNHVKLIMNSLKSINVSFTKGKLGGELFISSDGTDRRAACASLEDIDEALNYARSHVASLGSKSLPLTAFEQFVEGADAADCLLSTDKPFDVYLLHALDGIDEHHAKVEVVAEALEARGILCWLREEEEVEQQHEEVDENADTLDSMVNGIDRSKAVVVFVTRTYMQRVNRDKTEHDTCRDEFCYALQRVRAANMLPYVVDDDMMDVSEWEGRFGTSWNEDALCVRMPDLASEVDDLELAIRAILASQEDAMVPSEESTTAASRRETFSTWMRQN